MSKWINLRDKDNSIHRIAVLAADVTSDDKIIISYNDYTDGIHPGYAELINIDGVYHSKFDKREWNYYSTKFKDHDEELSNSIINALPEQVELYIEKNKKENRRKVPTDTKKVSYVDVPRNTTAYFLTAIIYANRGDDLYVNDGYSNLPPVFFTRRMLDDDVLVETYKKRNIDPKDHDELIEQINTTLRGKMHISTLPEDFRYEVSSGNKYYVNFSSCDNEKLFCEVALSDEIRSEISVGIKSGIYDDNLSAALHRELLLELVSNDDVIRYEPEFYGKKNSAK